MTHKSDKIMAMVAHLDGTGVDPRYAGFFECFNRQEFFEAHEVLEDLWLEDRQSPNYAFHKGLIQLAGAFVHLQKGRLRPADALFRLCVENLQPYGAWHQALNLSAVKALIYEWRERLSSTAFTENPWLQCAPPRIELDVARQPGA